ncbi:MULTISPECIES: helix-turn-helix transcriptional regulator [unclassified Phaeobacter]|uniref:helix-turn-helix transcriptional regulator n=2 Tax=Roseobacteraceae TaxID=2854170 RepID=UPI003A85A973
MRLTSENWNENQKPPSKRLYAGLSFCKHQCVYVRRTCRMSENFSRNLRSLCADYGSIAQVCRDIGLNRQQFNRYLNGGGMPSAHNLRRIARHFNISEQDLDLDHPAFLGRMNRLTAPSRKSPARVLSRIFENQAGPLRRYLGFYHGHFTTPTWEGKIMRTLIWLREQDGYIVSHTFERALSDDQSIVQRTKYTGLAAYKGNRIYLLESANSEDGFLSESILFPAHRQQVRYLNGMTMGVATKPRMAPYSSPTVWKRLSESTSVRDALKQTGIFRFNDTRIDVIVRNQLADAQD